MGINWPWLPECYVDLMVPETSWYFFYLKYNPAVQHMDTHYTSIFLFIAMFDYQMVLFSLFCLNSY